MIAAVLAAAIAIATPTPAPQPPSVDASIMAWRPTPLPTTGVPAPGTVLSPGTAYAMMRRAEGFSTRMWSTPRLPTDCGRRVLCQMLPHDRAERTAFVVDMGLAVLDDVVTQAGLRGGRATHPDLWQAALRPGTPGVCVAYGHMAACMPGAPAVVAPPGVTPASGALSWPASEGDPLMMPFAHGGLAVMLSGHVLYRAMVSYRERTWSPRIRTAEDYVEAVGHVDGIASWLPILAQQRADGRLYQSCARQAHTYGLIEPTNTGTATIMTLRGVDDACQPFSSLPFHG